MAFTDPHDWTVNEVVTAPLLDANVMSNLLGVPHPVHTESTTITINNTATETSLFSVAPVIAANAMGTSGWVRVHLWGSYIYNTASARTMTVRTKFGGVTHISTLLAAGGANATTRDWRLEADVINLSSASVQRVQTELLGSDEAGDFAFDAVRQIYGIGGAAGAINTASNQTLDITVQWSAADAQTTWTKIASRVMLMQA